jgi:hypothetical protein
MQATRNDHDQIGDPLFRVTQHLFDDATALHPREGMFYLDPNA